MYNRSYFSVALTVFSKHRYLTVKGFVWNLNNNGPISLPCETSNVTSRNDDDTPSMTTKVVKKPFEQTARYALTSKFLNRISMGH